MSAQAARFDDPNFCIQLRLEISLDEAFDPLVQQLTDAIHEHLGLGNQGGSRDNTRRAVSMLLANLFRARQCSPDMYVAISRRRGAYGAGDYNPNSVGYEPSDRALDYLEEVNLIELRPGGYFQEKGKRIGGFTTRIRATAQLMELISGLSKEIIHKLPLCITGKTIEWTDPQSPLLRGMYRQSDLPSVRLKDKKKRLIDYEENLRITLMKRNLQQYNSFLSDHWIDLLLPNDEFKEVVNGTYEGANDTDAFGEKPDPRSRRLDLVFQRELYRVFNNGSFSEGGRFFGGWWIHAPRRYRRFITINWTPVVELDFSNMQPAMLYAMKGLSLEGDAYAIEGIDPKYRDLLKKTLMKLINATGRIKPPKGHKLPKGWSWPQVQDAMREKHEKISEYFHSGIGIRLQRKESNIAQEVMMTMAREGRLVLPIHDSFLIAGPAQKDPLKQVMAKAYKGHMGNEIGIKPDDSIFDKELAWVEELEGLHVHFFEHEIDEMERKPEYSDYRRRKSEFLADKDEEWRWQFYPRSA